jgi:hypothetical protein
VALIVAALAVLIVIGSTPRPWRGPDRRRPGGADRQPLDAEAVAAMVAALAALFVIGSTPRPWPDRRRAGGSVRQPLDAEAVARPGSSPSWRC